MSHVNQLQSSASLFGHMNQHAQQQIDRILRAHEQLFVGDQDEDSTGAASQPVALETLLEANGQALAPGECYVRIMERRPKARPVQYAHIANQADVAVLAQDVQVQLSDVIETIVRAVVRIATYVRDAYVNLALWIEEREDRVQTYLHTVREERRMLSAQPQTQAETKTEHTQEMAELHVRAEVLANPSAPYERAVQYSTGTPTIAAHTIPSETPSTDRAFRVVAGPSEQAATPGVLTYTLRALKRDLLGNK